MNAQYSTVERPAADTRDLLEQLEGASANARQTIESVKQALLLADRMAIFGSNLACRLNAGTEGEWNRRAPTVNEGPAFLEAARHSLAAMGAELAALDSRMESGEEGLEYDAH